MDEKVYVIDVGCGNLQSLQNAVELLGFSVEWIRNEHEAQSALLNATRIILPGVGNFGHFMQEMAARNLVEPVKQFIESGKPIMGICVGLQAVFSGSTESPLAHGLGLLPLQLSRFDDTEKAVPHIGWNSAINKDKFSLYGIQSNQKYYFVNSYAAIVDENQLAKWFQGWDYCLTKYGSQTFISAMSKDNVFLTQFHPEKSSEAGLLVIKSFLNGDRNQELIHSSSNSSSYGLTKRIIACLDVRSNDDGDLVVTKGDQYDVRERRVGEDGNPVRNLGKPVEVAEKYYKQGADEVTFLNITSFRNSPLADLPMLEVLRKTSKTVFVPLTIGGGIRDTLDPVTKKLVPALEVAELYFRSGADKVSIGGDAVLAAEEYYSNGSVARGTSPIETISKAYGAQAVVVSVDPKRIYVSSPDDIKHHTIKTKFPSPSGEKYVWYQCTIKGGRETRNLGAYELVQAAEALGAGEILLNCIDKDGTNSGFDLELINDIKSAVKIPVIASSGAGNPAHFREVFEMTNTDAALGAGMFHRNEYTVEQVKEYLRKQNLPIR